MESAPWLIYAAVSGIAILAILHCAATAIRNADSLHDLRVRVANLRLEKLERIRQLAEQAAAEQAAPMYTSKAA